MKFDISIALWAVLVRTIGFPSPVVGQFVVGPGDGHKKNFSPRVHDVGQHILCPGQAEEDYCDCLEDCSGENASFCSCAEAQTSECCVPTTVSPSPTVFMTMPDSAVLCPGQLQNNWCDCGLEDDCKGNPEFCSCAAAQECCSTPKPSATSGVSMTKNSSSIHFGLGVVLSIVTSIIV